MPEFIDEIVDPQDLITPSLEEMLRQAMSGHTQEMRVAMPAEVVTYDYQKQMVSVKPYFKRKYKDGKLSSDFLIHNVPVCFPRAGDSFISLPLEKGHSVLLIFSDRSLEKWLKAGTITDPEDSRQHHISDAIAIPGCYPYSKTASVANATDLIMVNSNGKGSKLEVRLKKNNHLQILNDKEELVKILNDMLQIILDARTPTCGGPQPLVNPLFPKIKARLKTFLEK